MLGGPARFSSSLEVYRARNDARYYGYASESQARENPNVRRTQGGTRDRPRRGTRRPRLPGGARGPPAEARSQAQPRIDPKAIGPDRGQARIRRSSVAGPSRPGTHEPSER